MRIGKVRSNTLVAACSPGVASTQCAQVIDVISTTVERGKRGRACRETGKSNIKISTNPPLQVYFLDQGVTMLALQFGILV
jgi:hypothetical protein